MRESIITSNAKQKELNLRALELTNMLQSLSSPGSDADVIIVINNKKVTVSVNQTELSQLDTVKDIILEVIITAIEREKTQVINNLTQLRNDPITD